MARTLLDYINTAPRHLADRAVEVAVSRWLAYIIDLCRTHHIPLPQTNVPLLGEVVDAYWPDHRVVVEADGMTWHGTRAAARRDRRNDGDRMADGIITVRVTDERAQQDGRAVAAAIIGAMRR